MHRIFTLTLLVTGLFTAPLAHAGPIPKLTTTLVDKLIACPLLGPMNTHILDKRRQLSLRTCEWVKNKHHCKFTKRGIYRGQWRYLAWNFRVSKCIGKVLKLPHLRKKGMKAVAALAGVPLTRKSKTKGATYYNPALFRWLKKWIPEKSISVGDYEYVNIYKLIFQRHVRISAYTYLYLKQASGRALTQTYIKTHTGAASSQRLPQRALRAKVMGVFQSLVQDPIAGSMTSGAGEIALFWMRRKIDGSDKAIWELLTTLMKQYDAAFLRRILQKKPLGKLRLKLPKKQPFRRNIWGTTQPSQVAVTIGQTTDRVRIQLQAGVHRQYGLELPEDVSGNGKRPVKEVTLEGTGKGKTIIEISRSKETALFIENAQDIVVRKLHFRYRKKGKHIPCKKQILRIKRAKRVWIDQLVLDSPCPVGILIEDSEDIVISRITLNANIPVAFKVNKTKRLWLYDNTLKKSPRRIVCKACTWVVGLNLKKSWAFGQSIKKKHFMTR